MTDGAVPIVRFRAGRGPAIAAVFAAAATSSVLLAVSPPTTDIGGRLALAGLCVFVIALAVGSPRAVGLSTLVMLGAALAATSSADDVWVVSAVTGVGWYVAVESAWHSIDRREWVWADPMVVRRRVGDVATVAFAGALISALGLALSGAAPDRTVWSQAVVVVAVLAAVTAWTRGVQRQSNRD